MSAKTLLPPHQTHSATSVAGAARLSPARANAQERWVYEALRSKPRADWELWRMASFRPDLFDQISSMRRARIGLVWVNRVKGPTPYHPVEDSGSWNVNPESNVESTIWQIKPIYLNLTYDYWMQSYKKLIKQAP